VALGLACLLVEPMQRAIHLLHRLAALLVGLGSDQVGDGKLGLEGVTGACELGLVDLPNAAWADWEASVVGPPTCSSSAGLMIGACHWSGMAHPKTAVRVKKAALASILRPRTLLGPSNGLRPASVDYLWTTRTKGLPGSWCGQCIARRMANVVGGEYRPS
jgi:hypothetical protein